MKIQISLSKDKKSDSLPPLSTFLSKHSVAFLNNWVSGAEGIHEQLASKGISVLKEFESVRKQMKNAGLLKPFKHDLYRGIHLSGTDFVQFIRTGKLAPRSEVASWTTNEGTAYRYVSGIQSKERRPFGIVFRLSKKVVEPVLDMTAIEKQFDTSVHSNEEVILKDVHLKTSDIYRIYCPLVSNMTDKMRKEAFKAVQKLYAQGLMVDKPDDEFFMFRLRADGKLSY